jgi:hypothetical protein
MQKHLRLKLRRFENLEANRAVLNNLEFISDGNYVQNYVSKLYNYNL